MRLAGSASQFLAALTIAHTTRQHTYVVLPPPRRRRRSKARVKLPAKARICKSIATSHERGLRLPQITASRCSAKHCDRSADADRVEERNCILFGHSNTAV